MYDVFLSHNSADKPAVEELASRLRRVGLEPFLDTWHLIPGQKWQPAIERALEASKSAAIFIGPSGISPWHNEEMQAALARAVHSRDEYRVIPVLLPGADEQVVTGFIGQRTWVDFRSGLDWEESFRALVAGVTGVPPQQRGAGELPDEPAPYRGLRKFEQRHAALFFGRDREVQEVLKKLEQSSFAAVVGASGAGKSSLVNAGVIPKLEHSKAWAAPLRTLAFTPGANPLRAVADHAVALLPLEIRLKCADYLEERMLQRPDGLRTALATWTADPEAPKTIVLVIDQLEELFTRGEGEGSQARIKAFADNLRDVAERGSERIRVLTAVRADFLDRFMVIEPLRALLLSRNVQLNPMDPADFRDAIVRPATAVGAQFETGVVSDFMRELEEEANVLPLLEYALDLLWRNRKGIWLTAASYEAIGGLKGALRKHADDCLRGLGPEEVPIARDIFLRLVSLGEGVPDTKRRVPLDELSALGASQEQIDRVVQLLSGPEARLLVVDRQAGHRSPEVEVCHEILIQEWPVLRGWVDGERRRLQIHRRLGVAARDWADHDRSSDFLLAGARLTECEEHLTPQNTALNELELGFLFASLEARYEALQVDERWRREREDAHRRVDFQAAQVKEREERIRQLQRTLASTRSRELAGAALRELDSDPQAALLLLQEAYRTVSTEMVDKAMRRYHLYPGRVTFKGHSGSVTSAAFSPDGRRIVTASLDGTARIWDAATRMELVKLQGHSGVVLSACFNRNGRKVLTSGEDGTARLWDATSGQELVKLKGHSGVVWSTAFGPDGNTAATADAGGTVYLWNLAGGRPRARLEGHSGAVLSVAFNSGGSLLVTASKDETARVWDATRFRELTRLVGHSGWVRSAAFNLDGKVVVTGGEDGTARLWNAASGEALGKVESHSGAVMTVAFRPDGRWVLMGGDRGAARVLDASSHTELEKLEGHTDVVMGAAFSADGLRVVTASRDTTARVWDAAGRRGLGKLEGHAGQVWCAAYSPDGRWVVTAGEDGTTRLWDAVRRQAASRLEGYSGVVRGVAFSPDSREVVTAGEDGVARFWDVTTGLQLAKLEGHFGWVWAAAFSLDGARVVTVGHDGTARIWERARCKELVKLEGHAGVTLSAAFSPDGRRVVTASQDGTARLWDAESGKELAILNSHSGAVWSVAFSPDGQQVATASQDGIVRVWDAASYQELAKLEGHAGVVWSVAFSSDGRRLGSAGQDGTARVWDTASYQALAKLEDRSAKFLMAAFSPDGKRLATAGDDGTTRLWPSWQWEPADDRLLAIDAGRPFTPEERRRLLHE